MEVLAIRATLADSSYIDYFTAVPLYLKLCGDFQSCSSGVFKTVHIGCKVLYYVLPNLTSDVVLGKDRLHAINPRIEWNTYSLYLDFRAQTIRILETIQGCFHAFVEVCALKLMLKTMCCDKVIAWFGV